MAPFTPFISEHIYQEFLKGKLDTSIRDFYYYKSIVDRHYGIYPLAKHEVTDKVFGSQGWKEKKGKGGK